MHSADLCESLLPSIKRHHEEGGQPVGPGVVTPHHIVLAGPHVGVPDLDQPRRGGRVDGEQPGGDVVETPGSGEVQAVKVDQFAISSVRDLHQAVGVQILSLCSTSPG